VFVYWVLFEVCSGWTGLKEDVQVCNILFFLWKSCAEVRRRGSSSCRTETEERERDQLGAGTGAWRSGSATEKRQKIRKKIFEG
jgi:hypothetical protein